MKITKFQVIVLIIFIIFIVAGVATFALYKGDSSTNQIPAITVWGTFPKDQFDRYVNKINQGLQDQLSIRYTEYDSSTFSQEFVAALARGSGPDAVLIPSDMLLPAADKLTAIPYSSYPQSTFQSQFIDEARIYLMPSGVLGIPFSIDPLVMYWNRDMFNTAGVALPPKYWDQFTSDDGLVSKLTEKDGNGTITKSALAMGDFTNVVNAREILGSLFLQSGNPVTRITTDGLLESTLKPTYTQSPTPAVTFFTQFVDPSSANYSWNKSWPDSKTAFVAGRLGTYFGFASELFNIRSKNPNLNYDVAPLPQLRQNGVATTYGRIYAFSITRQSSLANAALTIIYQLTAPQNMVNISNDLYLPSVSRSIIAAGSKDPYITTFNRQALISRTWLDSDPAQSRNILGGMVQAITTGQKSIYQALNDAAGQYDAVLRQALGALAQ